MFTVYFYNINFYNVYCLFTVILCNSMFISIVINAIKIFLLMLDILIILVTYLFENIILYFMKTVNVNIVNYLR